MQDAQAIGYSLQDIVDVIQRLRPGDFVKSATAHNPLSSTIWHDTYETKIGRMLLYLKFAGVALIDVKLVSFKEAR